MPVLTVYAGNALTREQLSDDSVRAERLAAVEQMIVGYAIAGVQDRVHLDAGCCFLVQGNETDLEQLQQALKTDGVDAVLEGSGQRFRG